MKKQIPTPTFETDRLVLRPLTVLDIPAYQKAFNSDDILMQMGTNVPYPYPDNGAEHYFKNYLLPFQGQTRWDWGIFEKSNPEILIGSGGIWTDYVPGNAGCWLSKDYWSKSYMDEIFLPVHDFAFNVADFKSLILTNAVQNIGSRRIKEKNGAKLICLEKTNYINKNYSLSELWILQKNAWMQTRETKPEAYKNYRKLAG